MIAKITPRNFKCFHEEHFRLAGLTLLTGGNGSGKSSLLQALLLVRQSVDPMTKGPFVRLNGPYELQLGQALDVFNLSVTETETETETEAEQRILLGLESSFGTEAERSILLGLEFSTGEHLSWEYEVGADESLVMRVRSEPTQLPQAASGLVSHFTYLAAERVGPRDVSEMDARPADNLGVGTRGQFTAQVLVHREREQVREPLRHPRTAEEGGVTYLGKQVEFWMREMVPGLELRAQSFQGTNTVALRMRRSGSTLEWLRPTNMAFGATYALPIVVAGLLAPAGALLLVENPEAHLHPAAQSRMGRFLATLAAAGVQVLVETHSDHVLNGARLAAATELIQPEQILIHHFSAERGQARALEIRVTRDGGLSTWPKGFFDQSERDLAALVKARRRG